MTTFGSGSLEAHFKMPLTARPTFPVDNATNSIRNCGEGVRWESLAEKTKKFYKNWLRVCFIKTSKLPVPVVLWVNADDDRFESQVLNWDFWRTVEAVVLDSGRTSANQAAGFD